MAAFNNNIYTPTRRTFLKTTGTASMLISLGMNPLELLAADAEEGLTLLHTNDVHSRVEPFPMDGGRNEGLGGTAARAALIKKIRAEEKNVLLIDAGDVFQGTPYFNFYGGGLELELMTAMGYEACTMGNHDFDNGISGFLSQLPKANFPFICSNYDFTDTDLQNKTLPYHIIQKGNIRIGIFGLGVELQGLVEKKNYGNTLYLDPVKIANEKALFLSKEKKCDLVICLSHLGYEYKDKKISDVTLARLTRNIDVIIGGHTHTFLKEPVSLQNIDGEQIIVNQVGWGGINLGRIDFILKKNRHKKNFSASLLEVNKMSIDN